MYVFHMFSRFREVTLDFRFLLLDKLLSLEKGAGKTQVYSNNSAGLSHFRDEEKQNLGAK